MIAGVADVWAAIVANGFEARESLDTSFNLLEGIQSGFRN